MHYFTEDSTWMIFLGIAVEAVLGVILLRTGRGVLLWAMLGVALLVIIGVGIEKLIVTENEEVATTLDDIAAALKANDLPKALTYISPSDQKSRADASYALNRCEITATWIHNLQITINPLRRPHTAATQFRGIINFIDRKGESPYQTYIADFTVDFRKEGDRWIVTGYTTSQPVR
jgi:hypothetical protein